MVILFRKAIAGFSSKVYWFFPSREREIISFPPIQYVGLIWASPYQNRINFDVASNILVTSFVGKRATRNFVWPILKIFIWLPKNIYFWQPFRTRKIVFVEQMIEEILLTNHLLINLNGGLKSIIGHDILQPRSTDDEVKYILM